MLLFSHGRGGLTPMANCRMIEDVNYMVSLYCPGSCVNCNLCRQDRAAVTKDEITAELFATALQGSTFDKTIYFDLTAGESQLSPKYVETVEIIARHKSDAVIHTNISGWYPAIHQSVTEDCLRFTKPELFKIDISLDGRPENYSKVRLVNEGWEKAVETARRLKDMGIPLRFVMVTYRETFRDIEWFVDFAKKEGVGYYIGYPRLSGFYFKNKDKSFAFTPGEIDEIEVLLCKVGWLTERRLPNWLWAKSVYQNNIPYFDCHMGRKAIVIDPYGNVFPCNDLSPALCMGSLKNFNGDLDVLLASAKAAEVIESIEQRKCQPCGMLCAQKIEFPWGKQSGLISGPGNNV